MEKRIFAVKAAVAAAAIGLAVSGFGIPQGFAAGGGHGAGGHGFGGDSAAHLGAQGVGNSNGPNALDRDKGLERAQDRMAEQGLEHSKAGRQKTKAHKKAHEKAHKHAKKHDDGTKP